MHLSRSDGHFPAISGNVGGISFHFSRHASKHAPTVVWLPMNQPGLGRTTKPCFSASFIGFLGDFWTSVDVSGGLWSWDGWPPNCYSKWLFKRTDVSRWSPYRDMRLADSSLDPQLVENEFEEIVGNPDAVFLLDDGQRLDQPWPQRLVDHAIANDAAHVVRQNRTADSDRHEIDPLRRGIKLACNIHDGS